MEQQIEGENGEVQLTPPISGSRALGRILEERSSLWKEDHARWAKDHPLREPGTSLRTWKTESRIRKPTKAFREGYDKIDWSS